MGAQVIVSLKDAHNVFLAKKLFKGDTWVLQLPMRFPDVSPEQQADITNFILKEFVMKAAALIVRAYHARLECDEVEVIDCTSAVDRAVRELDQAVKAIGGFDELMNGTLCEGELLMSGGVFSAGIENITVVADN